MSLKTLAVQINLEHSLAMKSVMSAFDHAELCGNALIKAKGTVEYGEWMGWCKGNLKGLSQPQINRYMRTAKVIGTDEGQEYISKSDNPTMTGLIEATTTKRSNFTEMENLDNDTDESMWPAVREEQKEDLSHLMNVAPPSDSEPDAPLLEDVVADLSASVHSFLAPSNTLYQKIAELSEHLDKVPEKKRASMEGSLRTLSSLALYLADKYSVSSLRAVK